MRILLVLLTFHLLVETNIDISLFQIAMVGYFAWWILTWMKNNISIFALIRYFVYDFFGVVKRWKGDQTALIIYFCLRNLHVFDISCWYIQQIRFSYTVKLGDMKNGFGYLSQRHSKINFFWWKSKDFCWIDLRCFKILFLWYGVILKFHAILE